MRPVHKRPPKVPLRPHDPSKKSGVTTPQTPRIDAYGGVARNRNLKMSRALIKSQAQGTSLFMSAATNQRFSVAQLALRPVA